MDDSGGKWMEMDGNGGKMWEGDGRGFWMILDNS